MAHQHPPSDSTTRRRIPAGLALLVMTGALLIGLFVNAPDILRTAERQEQGWQRTIGVAVMQPISSVSHFLFLDRPRQAIDLALGRATASPDPGQDSTPSTTTTSTTAPEGEVTSTTAAPVAARRPITADDPMIMYVGGDSMVGQFGPMLANRADRSGLIETEFVYEFESGLSRPDFVDWPARLDQVRVDLNPDVLVLFFGGNDAQGIYMPDGSWINFDTPEWETEYRRRVDDVMSTLEDDGRWVYWMGMPIVRSDTFRPRVQLLNEIYESVAADHPQVTFIESWSVFQGPDGGYSEYLEDANGDLVDMRLDDGVHLTTAGAIRLAEVVYSVIATDWDLPPE